MSPGQWGKESSDMECPVCHEVVPYLVGEDTKDGGKKGCEKCWKPPATPVQLTPPPEPSGDPIADYDRSNPK